MKCRIVDLRGKEVINICDGCRLGFPVDVDIEMPGGHVVAIVVLGPGRFFGLFGKGAEFIIPWHCVKRVGDDLILVEKEGGFKREAKPDKGHWLKL